MAKHKIKTGQDEGSTCLASRYGSRFQYEGFRQEIRERITL